MLVERACIVGLGLLGGSLALALRGRGVAREVVGTSRREATLTAAIERDVVGATYPRLENAVSDSDFVVVCTPVGIVPTMVERMAPSLPAGALVSDVGSTKRWIVESVERLQKGFRFVGGHPLAGSEATGLAHAREDLFEGRTYFITPTPRTDERARARLTQIVEAIGAKPVTLSPEEHDRLLAATSHMPHLLACLAVALTTEGEADGVLLERAIGQGFLDVTRVAAGSAEIWTDIFLTNAAAMTGLLDRLGEAVKRCREWLSEEGREELWDWLDEMSELRRQLGGRDDG